LPFGLQTPHNNNNNNNNNNNRAGGKIKKNEIAQGFGGEA
jgi:hypothetical protein